jgi:hypothetical protein
MTSSKITAMATLALALVLIGSVITGHLFVVNALLPNTPVVASQKTTTTKPIITTQTSSFDPARVLVQDAIIALQNSDNNKALVHLKLADQQLAVLPNGGNSSSIQPTRILLADAVQALVQNSDNNKALVHLKLADQQLSTATSENTVSPNAASESSKVLMAMAPSKNTGAVTIAPSTTSIYNLILEGKNYPIKYQITGDSNKLNYMTTRADKAAILANVTSQSTGKLIIELPRILLESKKAGLFFVSIFLITCLFGKLAYFPVRKERKVIFNHAT